MSTRGMLGWLLGAALVAAGGAVVLATPPAEVLQDPFLIHGGESVQTRNLIASIEGASFADEITEPGEDWSATGNWLVVTVAASAPLTEVDAEVGVVSLVVDGVTYTATERVRASLTNADLRVGTATVGMLAFELPEGLRHGAAELRLPARILTPILDDVAVLALDLDGLGAEKSVEIVEPTLGAP